MGDSLANSNKGDRTSKHNGVLRAGDFATMRDVHYEVKCWNPLIKSTTSGRGSWDNGGNVSSVGHLYGFGNTLDKALTGVVGCKERGRQVDGPLDHSTVGRDGSKTTRRRRRVGQEGGWKWTRGAVLRREVGQ